MPKGLSHKVERTEWTRTRDLTYSSPARYLWTKALLMGYLDIIMSYDLPEGAERHANYLRSLLSEAGGNDWSVICAAHKLNTDTLIGTMMLL